VSDRPGGSGQVVEMDVGAKEFDLVPWGGLGVRDLDG
jgi:hypothetical protein